MGKEVVCLNLRSFLAAVALTTLMLALMLAPPSGSQLQRQYDPWADINDDGLIDMRDIAYEARLFGTTGDPTKNVNVTNWMRPRPKAVLYAVYNLTWGAIISLTYKLISGGGRLYVGDYRSVVVQFEFSNIRVSASESGEDITFWVPEAIWANTPESSQTFSEIMSLNQFSIKVWGPTYEILSGTIGRAAGAWPTCKSLAPYVIRAPYLEIKPFSSSPVGNFAYNATAICRVYIYLNDSPILGKPVQVVYHYDSTIPHSAMGFGYIPIQGFKKFTVRIWSNVNYNVHIYCSGVSAWDYEKRTGLSAGTTFQGTYEVLTPLVGIYIYTSSNLFKVSIQICLIE